MLEDTNNKKTIISKFFSYLSENETFKFFRDDYKDIYAQYIHNGNVEIRNIRSQEFITLIASKYYSFTGNPVSLDTIKSQIDSLPQAFSQDINHLPQYNLDVRVCKKNNKFYYDLCDKDWNIVEIDEQGWKIKKQEEPIFRRNNGQNSQEIPINDNCFQEIFEFLNINEKDQILLAVSLVSYLIPNIDHPIIMFSGKPGVSKTTSHSIIKYLIDPTIVSSQKLPRDDKDLLIQWKSQYVLFYDNISTMSSDMSDAFCRGVTGEGSSSRKLYTDNDEVYYNLRRCFLVNGIDQPGTKPDLMQRSVLIELDPISSEKRKTKEDIFNKFNELKPRLLGSMFNIISRAMTIKKNIVLKEIPRLADFAYWGEAISQAIGFEKDLFINDLLERQNQQEKNTADYDPLYNAILSVLEDNEEIKEITGTSTFILERLKEKTSFEQRKYLPHSVGSLGKKLARMKEIYNKSDLVIDTRVNGGKNIYSIYMKNYENKF